MKAAMRFTKRLRLLNAAQFDAAFKRGKRFSAGAFTAIVAPNDLDFARIGFALSKRQAPSSVVRNRVRRQLREQFRLQQQQLSAVDLVLMLKAKLPEDQASATRAVQQFWSQLAKRCAKP